MAPQPSVLVKKTFQFLGNDQVWSNRYHFGNGLPATDADWRQFFDNIVAAEKLCHPASVEIIECVGYLAGATVGHISKSYTELGTMATGGGQQAPGDVAALIRYSTTQRTSKNHPVYLFNYYHGVIIGASGVPGDGLYSGQKTQLEAYADKWLTPGITDGVIRHPRVGPNGAVAQSRFVHPLLTHRDFPR